MTDSASGSTPAHLWARVQILLNLERIEDAVVAASEAAQASFWGNDDYMQIGGIRIFSCDDLPVGWCFLDPGNDLAVVNTDVVDTYCTNVYLFRFVNVGQSLSAPTFRRYDVSSWKTLNEMDEAARE